ncbi:FMN-binding protein [Cryptosporangium sp. NPDC051539]|uniref:FMN-binding protein n=1 Tax=Cryptosporangium sp. NPDC051539 TaxID=3363962 RepID=UPI0037B1AE65
MRRIVVATVATASGLVSLLGLKSYTGHPPVSSTLPAVVAVAPAAPSPTSPSSAASPPASSTSAAASVTVTGDVATYRYGSIQVRVTVTGGAVSKVAVVQLDPNEPQSAEIDARAVPQLQQETLGVSSAQVDTVSGATYTSEAYQQSLQSALDKAGLQK